MTKPKNPGTRAKNYGIKKDWTGKKYGRFTFIELSDKRRGNGAMWVAQCECGTIKTVLPAPIARGDVKSCGCANHESRVKNGKTTRKFHPIESSARIVWGTSYNDGDVSFADFMRLSQLACHYCNRAPFRTFNKADSLIRKRKDTAVRKKYVSEYQKTEGNFTYNGLDRIDSRETHTIANVVPCCYFCNWMKSNLTQEEFIRHVDRIHYNMLPEPDYLW
jgi:hypothetical protein